MQFTVAHLETQFKNQALATQNMLTDMHSALDLTNKRLGPFIFSTPNIIKLYI